MSDEVKCALIKAATVILLHDESMNHKNGAFEFLSYHWKSVLPLSQTESQ